MRKQAELDWSKAVRNPHAEQLTQPVTVRLDEATIHYFQQHAEELRMPWESLLGLYLRNCAHSGFKIPFEWAQEQL
ncbi:MULTISPECIES: antitoxin [unclassified Massilia]|uniref:antitoxin n=1 Tax=unclassified Massilia TaxID=2609279 RepID=UPI001593DDFA|nr:MULTISPECIES: antitoxin [unclassified Massilia]NVD98493.1 antitoxin [Massilia sp. BJB1822]UTY58442.1 antitoxin [Massilia sp. erpn]